MQEIAPVIAFVGVMVFLAHLFTAIFSRTRVPDVLLLILIGIAIGPVLGLASPEQFGAVGGVLAMITLIIILFESGTTLELLTLRRSVAGAMALATVGFFLTMFATAGVAYFFTDLELIPSFILGAIVGSISEAIVIPLIQQLKMRKDSQTILGVESSVNDVLSIVLTIALVEAYTMGEFNLAPVAGSLIASFLVAIIIGIVGAFIWAKLLKRIHAIKNTLFTTPAFVFIIFGVVEILGFNGAIASLAFGITLGNIESIRFYVFRKPRNSEAGGLNQTERIFFSEVAFLLKTFFFVYLGISLQIITGWMVQMALIFTVLVFILRIPAVKLTVARSVPVRDASLMAIMVPKGLAAAVLAVVPLQRGVVGGEFIRDLTYGLILLSIVGSSILLLLLEGTPLRAVYAWFFNPRLPADPFGWVFRIPRPRMPHFPDFSPSAPDAGVSEKPKSFPAETLPQYRRLFRKFGKTPTPGELARKKGILDVNRPGKRKK
ncbi:MAG: cation:proton antiporter [Chloroflexota bacterium]